MTFGSAAVTLFVAIMVLGAQAGPPFDPPPVKKVKIAPPDAEDDDNSSYLPPFTPLPYHFGQQPWPS